MQRDRQRPRLPSAWSLIAGLLFGAVVAAAMFAIYYAVPRIFDAPAFFATDMMSTADPR